MKKETLCRSISVRMTDKLFKKIASIAEEQNRSFNFCLLHSLQHLLTEKEKENEDERLSNR